MTEPKFYRTLVTFEVLSEEPIPSDMDIATIVYECDEGGYVMTGSNRTEVALSGAEMAQALREAGSEPEFFQLDDEGNPIEESDTMTPEEARQVERPTIEPGQRYAFYAEMQQEYEPAPERMRNYTNQRVTVLSKHPRSDPEGSTSYRVRADDGREFSAMEEELNGWDRDLGQYFWPDGTYGPHHETWPLANERD